jgi:hypothetical protein
MLQKGANEIRTPLPILDVQLGSATREQKQSARKRSSAWLAALIVGPTYRDTGHKNSTSGVEEFVNIGSEGQVVQFTM